MSDSRKRHDAVDSGFVTVSMKRRGMRVSGTYQHPGQRNAEVEICHVPVVWREAEMSFLELTMVLGLEVVVQQAQ